MLGLGFRGLRCSEIRVKSALEFRAEGAMVDTRHTVQGIRPRVSRSGVWGPSFTALIELIGFTGLRSKWGQKFRVKA